MIRTAQFAERRRRLSTAFRVWARHVQREKCPEKEKMNLKRTMVLLCRRRILRIWRQALDDKVREREHSELARSFYFSTLATKALYIWRLRVDERIKNDENNRIALHFRLRQSQKFLFSLLQRNKKRRKNEEKADFLNTLQDHIVSGKLRRAFIAWKDRTTHKQMRYVLVREMCQARDREIKQSVLSLFARNVVISKIEREKNQSAVVFRNRSILTRALRVWRETSKSSVQRTRAQLAVQQRKREQTLRTCFDSILLYAVKRQQQRAKEELALDTYEDDQCRFAVAQWMQGATQLETDRKAYLEKRQMNELKQRMDITRRYAQKWKTIVLLRQRREPEPQRFVSHANPAFERYGVPIVHSSLLPIRRDPRPASDEYTTRYAAPSSKPVSPSLTSPRKQDLLSSPPRPALPSSISVDHTKLRSSPVSGPSSTTFLPTPSSVDTPSTRTARSPSRPLVSHSTPLDLDSIIPKPQSRIKPRPLVLSVVVNDNPDPPFSQNDLRILQQRRTELHDSIHLPP
ncbi:putative protein SFI1 [Blattamonas nauphoetae]|uniref:Sfi1 spindle body domain-containing protein n=1 Tax=Blattamonas nauphoetae TaxID=2049346 RepID=A0ABQ9XIP3_9EUKA|nr:putative protein SFI1 [Blattamonas nauphoetae]